LARRSSRSGSSRADTARLLLPTASGTICASGTLGQIISLSTILILLADILGQSVGTLFAAALIPGLVLSAIFCIYLLQLGIVRPAMVPPVALDERQAMQDVPCLRPRCASACRRSAWCWRP
jgi:TRAP-type mannitol/chloroaromatic compound transport system permease large subunit